jgi:endogenous inhibitor of DNA gyrase (YacG/DUF329 family)
MSTGATTEARIIAPCPTCSTGDLWARPGESTPAGCEECLAETRIAPRRE